MRLGGPVFARYDSPEQWVARMRDKGYAAAFDPAPGDASPRQLQAYRSAAAQAGVVLAEVGAWSNPISPDPEERRLAVDKCKRALERAEVLGARCCVNIAGSRSHKWDGPHPDNLSPRALDLIVTTVQEIIDAVGPADTTYTLETMPWVPPDSPASYEELLRAVDRRAFAVHLDPVNLVNSPQRFFDNAALLRDCFSRLGPHIRSCHAKDIALRDTLTVHLDEVRPGCGGLDYHTYLTELDRLGQDIPLMLEHLPDESEYDLAAAHIRAQAAAAGVELLPPTPA